MLKSLKPRVVVVVLLMDMENCYLRRLELIYTFGDTRFVANNAARAWLINKLVCDRVAARPL